MFNEGYTPGRPVRRSHPPHPPADAVVRRPEVAGLLALMLLHTPAAPTHRRARTLIPLDHRIAPVERGRITKAYAVLQAALARDSVASTRSRPPSPRCHDDARTAEETDWSQILAWYELLELTAIRLPRSARGRGRRGRRSPCRAGAPSEDIAVARRPSPARRVARPLARAGGNRDTAASTTRVRRPGGAQHGRTRLPHQATARLRHR